MTLAPLWVLAAAAWSAEAPAPCVRRAQDAVLEPATLDALVDCQNKGLDDAVARYAKKHGGKEPGQDVVELWQDGQRSETRGYLRRHPDRASVSDKKGEAALGQFVSGAGAGEEQQSAPAQIQAVDDAKLKQDLLELSNNGKNGVTPQMSDEITSYLKQKQGGVSPEMEDLLRSLQRDGASLTDESMLKLKKAARAADGQGLDLGVDQKTKDYLLDPGRDPKAGPPASD